MSSPLPIPPAEFESLSTEEQIEYVEKHFDYIASCLRNAEIPEWHREVLVERMAHYRSSIDGGVTWEEFEKELIND